MGRTPTDHDLTTSALPDDMLTLFAGYKILTSGLKHRTVTVIVDGIQVEITTYRTEALIRTGVDRTMSYSTGRSKRIWTGVILPSILLFSTTGVFFGIIREVSRISEQE